MDDVDRILAGWRRERPDLDVSPMEIMSRISRLAKQLDRARKATFDDHGLEMWAFDVLSALRRAGEPYQLSPSQLAAEVFVTSGTMTNRLERLATNGWVSRHADPRDRRSLLVRLTASGQERVDNALAEFLVQETRLLASLEAEEQDELADLLRRLSSGFTATAN